MTKKFRFRLERLLSLRKMEEKLRKAALARAQAQLVAAEESKRKAEADSVSCLDEIARLRRISPLPLLDCLQAESLFDDLRILIIRRGKLVALRMQEVEKARQEFLDASTRRKALSRIRDIREENYLKEVRKAEAKLFDQIASERAYAQAQEKMEEA